MGERGEAANAGGGGGRRSRGRAFALAAFAGIVSVPAGWVVSDRLERENDFCNACHLPTSGLEPAVPLHIDVRRDFDAIPPASLAAGHARAAFDGRPAGDFRCIDCHGGVGLVGRARVKALAAKDAFWYVVGRFEEPDGMRWPLWDEDCQRCHTKFDEGDAPEWETPRFHQLPVHNVELGVNCVECHLVHESGASPDSHFLHPAHVRSQCARCHSQFEEGRG